MRCACGKAISSVSCSRVWNLCVLCRRLGERAPRRNALTRPVWSLSGGTKARRVKSPLAHRVGDSGALRGVRALAISGLDYERRHDRRRLDGVPLPPQQVLQACAGPREDDQCNRAGAGRSGAHSVDSRRRRDHTAKPDARVPGSLRGNIVFEHVSFAYDPAAPVLRDINLTIKAGQRIGICGLTGSGKSTVLSLIPRFYDTTGATY